ncbi:MAG: preprotein translocase subunit YajC [Elusimicrobiota bacterium]
MFSLAYAMGTAPQGAQAQGGNPLVNLFPLFALLIIFYFFLIRPQQKRAKEHQRMLSELKQNDKVVTTGGIIGTIVLVKPDLYHLKVSDNVTIMITRDAIAKKVVVQPEVVSNK